jgi:hypothetical protein
MKLTKYAALLIGITGFASAATVNIQVSQGANQATNFTNADNSISNGLVWGLMFSTADASFSEFAPGFVLSTSLNGTLIPTTDDYFISSSVLTAQGTTTDIANPGKINIMNSIQMNVPATNAIVTGTPFAIVWFDSTITSATQALGGGTKYGLLSNAAWTIPAAGATQNISSFFSASPDPWKLANTFTVVPEPSAAILGAIGALGLLRRRRN